jgi:hypothetical protein
MYIVEELQHKLEHLRIVVVQFDYTLTSLLCAPLSATSADIRIIAYVEVASKRFHEPLRMSTEHSFVGIVLFHLAIGNLADLDVGKRRIVQHSAGPLVSICSELV